MPLHLIDIPALSDADYERLRRRVHRTPLGKRRISPPVLFFVVLPMLIVFAIGVHLWSQYVNIAFGAATVLVPLLFFFFCLMFSLRRSALADPRDRMLQRPDLAQEGDPGFGLTNEKLFLELNVPVSAEDAIDDEAYAALHKRLLRELVLIRVLMLLALLFIATGLYWNYVLHAMPSSIDWLYQGTLISTVIVAVILAIRFRSGIHRLCTRPDLWDRQRTHLPLHRMFKVTCGLTPHTVLHHMGTLR